MALLKRSEGDEQPCIPLGWLRLRLPFVHYRFTLPEFVAGIVCTFILFAVVPILTDVLGMTTAQAYTVIVIQMWLYLLHAHFGDPIVSGWVTPCIPLVAAFLLRFDAGIDRIYALMSLQMWFALFLIVLGATGAARPLVRRLPQTLKAGIILGAGIAGFLDVFLHDVPWNIKYLPVGILVGGGLAIIIVWGYWLVANRERLPFIGLLQQYGLPIGYVAGVGIATAVGEIAVPTILWSITPMDWGGMISGFTLLGVGFPPWMILLAALPLAIVIYITAYGDMVFAEACVIAGGKKRLDEAVPLTSNRTHIITGVRNIASSLFALTPAMAGPIWTSMTAIVADRWSKGRKSMESVWDGCNTFAWTMALFCLAGPVITLFAQGFAVALAIALIMQGFVAAYIGLAMVKYVQQRGIAIIMAVVLASQGALWGLSVGIVLYLLMEFRIHRKDRLPEPEVEILSEVE